METPPDQPGLPEDPEAPPEGDPPGREPKRIARGRGGWVRSGESTSLTGRYLESLENGTAPSAEEPGIPEPEGDLVRMGDPDVDPLQNEYAGDESPGASSPTPDQNLIDATGRAYGVTGAESGTLSTSSEVLDKRDHRRAVPRKDRRRL